MNGLLSQVSTGVTQAGQRIVIAAKEKMGKTTLACGAPGCLLIPLEMGYAAMPVAKVPMIETWEGIENFCLELIWAAQNGRIQRGSSLAWDSATALERAIHDNVIRTDPTYKPGNKGKLTMESSHGGYGKAYQLANELFARWTRYMDELAFKGGINIIVTCHSFPSKVIDPAHGEYETWDLLLHSPKNEKTYGKREFMTQWADLIGFLHEPMFVMQAQEGQKMNRAVSANQGRVLGIDRTPGWVAGNRYGMTGVIPIPMPPATGLPAQCWNALAHAIWNARGIDLWNRSV